MDDFMSVEARLNKIEGLLRSLITRVNSVTATVSFTAQSFVGSDCSGSDGAKNRVLTLSATPTAIVTVIVSNAALMRTVDYTPSGASITFLNELDNDQTGEVLYV